MSKNSNRQRMETFQIWLEDFKAKSKYKKKQSKWVKEIEDND